MFKRNLNIVLYLRGSCDQNKSESQEETDIEMWYQKFDRWLFLASESPKDSYQVHIAGT